MSFKNVLIYLCIILLLSTALLADDNTFVWQIGEELTYKVKWQFIRLGTLKLQVCDTLKIEGNLVYHIKLYLDSNPTLFFVNMHNVYETYIDENFRVQRFYATEKIDNITYLTEYRFNYQDSLIHVKMTDVKDTNRTIIEDQVLDERILDGISMVYYARANADKVKNEKITVFFEAKQGKVSINFKGSGDKIKIGALKKTVNTYYLDGKIFMKGIAGMTGPYKGWFATDSRRPPLKAKLKVWIGSVTVELEKWENWQPKMKN